MAALSESVMKNYLKRPLAKKSRWCHIWLAIKPCCLGNLHLKWKVTEERSMEIMVALLESVKKLCLKRPLVEKSRWRYIRLAVKSRYLGNHTSQIKSYYRTLSGSHGRSFRIRHKKLSEAPPSGKIMITSYPVGNETLFSRKLCIPDKKLLRNALRK